MEAQATSFACLSVSSKARSSSLTSGTVAGPDPIRDEINQNVEGDSSWFVSAISLGVWRSLPS
jgi:hypothetical protein